LASHISIVQNAGSFQGKENISGADIAMKNAANQKSMCVSYTIGLLTSQQGN